MVWIHSTLDLTAAHPFQNCTHPPTLVCCIFNAIEIALYEKLAWLCMFALEWFELVFILRLVSLFCSQTRHTVRDLWLCTNMCNKCCCHELLPIWMVLFILSIIYVRLKLVEYEHNLSTCFLSRFAKFCLAISEKSKLWKVSDGRRSTHNDKKG